MKICGLILLLISLLAAPGAVQAQGMEKGFLWDGTHWAQVTREGKAGYIWGMGNLADFEAAASQGKPSPVSRAFKEAVGRKSILQVVEEVDRYYKENPNQLKTTVIEVILKGHAPVSGGETKETKGGK